MQVIHLQIEKERTCKECLTNKVLRLSIIPNIAINSNFYSIWYHINSTPCCFNVRRCSCQRRKILTKKHRTECILKILRCNCKQAKHSMYTCIQIKMSYSNKSVIQIKMSNLIKQFKASLRICIMIHQPYKVLIINSLDFFINLIRNTELVMQMFKGLRQRRKL